MKKIIFTVSVTLSLVMISCDNDSGLSMLESEPSPPAPSARVSIDEALENAERMFEIIGSKTRTERKIESIERFKAPTRTDDNSLNGFYVVNYADNQGFALLGADKRLEAVYAISEEGSMHLSDTLYNKGLSWYLNDHLPLLTQSSIIAPIDTTTYPVVNPGCYSYEKYSDPLLTGFMSLFHQKSPHNIYCEKQYDADDEMYKNCVTGCAPLALGTIMGYYEWPTNADGYTFPWNYMKQSRSHSQWARLFELLGRQEYLNAIYGLEDTSVYRYPSLYLSTFSKMKYTNTSFEKFNIRTVQNELKKNSPVIVLGSYKANTYYGHVWIIDGGYTIIHEDPIPLPESGEKEIKTDHYFNCVWGEAGKANGYFLYYLSQIGGEPTTPTSSVNGSVPIFINLDICYGYTPLK